jgi:hypothetical protein
MPDDGTGQLAPRHARPDAVRPQQRVHRPAAARLAAAEGVRPLDRRLQRGARVGVLRLLGEPQERGERHLHGQLDVVAHLARQGACVARHLRRDRLYGLLGDARQVGAEARDDRRVEGQARSPAHAGTLGHRVVPGEQSASDSSPRTTTRLAPGVGTIEA